ncbi:energy transducer TonB [Flavobacteriaceae bacterium]|nr:energy transducer TonB [Flavobacteriaceae bacterium]MDA8849809.1 energy transducer TonB [Flavobacteriaceae bacterium]MDC0000727.1 energy transducer TonB [Flavobacteriaceae bacterium]
MEFLNTPHKKKSAGLTAIFAVLFLSLFFVLGLTYYDPPVSYGMEVNFGTSTKGSGNQQPQELVESKPAVVAKNTVEKTQVNTTQPPPKSIKVGNVVTEKESIVTFPEKETVIKEVQPETKIPEKVTEATPQKKVSKVSEATKNVVSNLLKNKTQQGEVIEGEGGDVIAGDKGKQTGDLYSSSYYNTAGLGGKGKGYGLNGRNLQSNGKVVQECNQEGIVVVRITVNNQGNVVFAEPGVKGSTNTHPCLLEPAKKTALLHKWYSDTKAPLEQVGFVVIQFKLGE